MTRLARAAVVVAAIPAPVTLSAVVERFDARADCLPYGGIAAGSGTTFGIRSDRTLWQYGQPVDDNTAPAVPVAIDDVTKVSSSTEHTLALRDGVVWSWGENDDGQLGDGSNDVFLRPFPLPVTGAPPSVDVAAGQRHSLAVRRAGKVWAWGNNLDGQLGDGTDDEHYVPVEVPGLSGVAAVAAGWVHSLALKTDGTVYAWGDNYSGQIGDGTRNNNRLSPVRMPLIIDAVAIAASQTVSLVLKGDGTVWKAGDGSAATVSGLSGIAAIAAGAQHWMALKSDGTVWTWGYNWYGAIGDGTTNYRRTPYRVLGLPAIAAIAAGDAHSVALDANGQIWAWGNNHLGQLGDSTSTDRTTPVRSQNVVQCFVPDLAPATPSPPSVSPLPTPSASGPSDVGEEAPVAECRFARYQGEVVYGGYAVVTNETPPVLTSVRCTVTTGTRYGERTGTAPGALATTSDTLAAPPAPVTVCTYAEAVYADNRVVSAAPFCRES